MANPKTRPSPGCGLCGELVASPHYCTAKADEAHATVLRLNARYRAALSALESVRETSAPDPIIPDLAQWGAWLWCQREGYEPTGIDRAAVARAARRVARLSPAHRAELRALYVDRCDAKREGARASYSVGQPKRNTDVPALTSAERAYLSAEYHRT